MPRYTDTIYCLTREEAEAAVTAFIEQHSIGMPEATIREGVHLQLRGDGSRQTFKSMAELEAWEASNPPRPVIGFAVVRAHWGTE